ncbi:hypothetical protein [Paenibacillus silvae]|uniref:Uncharacterized protein n=1 Tax=Paenibacillus silvae TaxID=1325358 RepID=A0A2W6NH36_9BACL|nr:hypothetical protein [Paenibacillus silvae]PZT54348.1 hypothetical protein DN757_17620 [Paenibacillus silvae]
MVDHSKTTIFKEQINDLQSHDWKIKYNPETDRTIIIDEAGNEISSLTLGFVGGELLVYINRREEEKLGKKERLL